MATFIGSSAGAESAPGEIGVNEVGPLVKSNSSATTAIMGGFVTPLVFLDIESQSIADLADVGARVYIRHPFTRLMMLVAKHQDGRTKAWLPHYAWPTLGWVNGNSAKVSIYKGPAVPRWLQQWIDDGCLFVGHNIFSFDAPFLKHHYGLEPQWYDTMHAARASGLPGGLDALGQALGGEGKTKDGKMVMRLLCQAKMVGGEVVYPVGTVALWQKLLAYNIRDVELTERVYQEVKGREEADVVRVDRFINERGIQVDLDWLRTLLDLWSELERQGGDSLARLTGGCLTRENVASVAQVKRWLELQGMRLPSVNGKTTINRKALEQVLETPEEALGDCDDAALIVEVLKLRQSMTRAMKGKLARIAETVDEDGRVRDWSVCYGAHTGRFTSRRIQLHNMARGVDMDMDDTKHPESLVEQIIKGPRTLAHIQDRLVAAEVRIKQKTGKEKKLDVDDVLATLVRPVFCAGVGFVLGICDYNAVEARGVAWLAGEQWLLDAFDDPKRDVYCEFGSRIFGRAITKRDKMERGIAKICVLGMGYGMGANKFAMYAKQSGIDLSSCGVVTLHSVAEWRTLGATFNPDQDTLARWEYDHYGHQTQCEIVARGLVKQYRESCPKITAMWREVGDQAEVAVRHGEGAACMGRVQFHTYGSPHLYLTLPSGRVLTYRNCRFERRVPAYCAALGLAPFEKDTLVYRTPRRYDSTLFGAKLVENIVQAFCRDLLCDALVRLAPCGPDVVLHVHDEIVCELAGPAYGVLLRRMCEIMSTPPSWAGGFPLRVEGFTAPRYVKTPWKDSVKADYMNGRAI